MRFGWINGINTVVVAYLILVNVIAERKKLADRFDSKHLAVNVLEQLGRYGCVVLMVFPLFAKDWKFGFASVPEMLVWVCITILLPVLYAILWARKADGGSGVLYGLAAVPAVLFLLNGILLRHPALAAASLLFGASHLAVVRENV